MVLPDTSVWVEYLRRGDRGRAGEIDELVARQKVVTCAPVVAELLAGTSRADRARLAAVLAALPWAELGRAQWIRVGGVAAELRGAGLAVPLTDVEIAVAAVEARATLWSADSDFERVAGSLENLELRPL
ncbi:MAG: PIN domain-containing protein [Thermoleophilaceae bacterium]